MTAIKGVYGAVDEVLAVWRNDIEDIRALIWEMFGQTQGIIRGFVMTPTVGSLALDFTAGAAIVEQRGTDITGDARAYFLYNDTTTVVTFGAPSAASRSDAVVFAWVDRQYGALGTGVTTGGPQIIVVPGVSGSVTPRTDAQIQTAIGVGGWFRMADVVIAPGNTVVAPGNITDNHPDVLRGTGPKLTLINATGNFTRASRPAATGARVRCWGAGGGGGAADGDGGGSGESGGGGGGEYREKWYTGAAWAALAKTFSVTVGTGGTGGVAGTGGTGGDTIFDTVTAKGGLGGATGSNTTTNNSIAGGAGGSGGAGGDLAIPGGEGGNGIIRSNIPTFTNYGGASPNGGGTTRYPPPFATGNGGAGKAPGGGGSGCYANAAVDRIGGAGAAGRVEVTEFFD
jgi:hypothetical protein